MLPLGKLGGGSVYEDKEEEKIQPTEPVPSLSHHVPALHQALLPAVFPRICKALSS